MKRPLTWLVALVTMVVLLGIGITMNSACKTSVHTWCGPPPHVRQGVTHVRKGDKLISPAISRVGSLSQR